MISERWKTLWYEFWYYPTAAMAFLAYSLRIRGRQNVPRKGGLLVIANHQSFLDPPLIGIAARRHLNYLARKTLFNHSGLAWVMNSLGAIPINQEASGTEGIKAALALLKAGKAVLIFPEGSRTCDGGLQELKPGIVVLIRRANVPVLPVGIAGAYEAWPVNEKRPRFSPFFNPANGCGIAVVVGKPIPPEKLVHLPPEEMLAHCHRALGDLRGQAEKLRRKE